MAVKSSLDGNKKENELAKSSLDFLQLNVRKTILSMQYVNQKCERKDSFCVFLQEPYCHKGRITGLNKQHQIFQSTDPYPRAGMYCSSLMPIFPMMEISDRDTFVAQ